MKKVNIKMLILTAMFAALTAVGAFIQVPLGFTSITLQVFFTCMAGVILGPKYGTLSQVVYVLLGLVGLPIFTQGGGFGYLVKPSMGFLFGLIPMALVVGLMTRRMNMNNVVMWYVRIFAAFLVGEVVLYAIGTPYMGVVLNSVLGKGMSAWAVFKAGCLIYLPGDLVKLVLAALICFPLNKALLKAGLLEP